MDADDNVRLVGKTYERFKSGDISSFLELLAEDVEWQLPAMEQVSFAGAWRGHAGVRQFLERLAATQDVIEFHWDKFIAQDAQVVVIGRFVMRVKATGRLSASEWAHIWTLSDGRVTRFREYVDTAAVSHAHSRAPHPGVLAGQVA